MIVFSLSGNAPMITERTAKLPEFYTHVIGSMPRPKVLLDLLHQKESMGEEEYNMRMDDMILFIIRLQEQSGLDVVSDGEWRRTHYIEEFLNRIGGFDKVRKYQHQNETKLTNVVVGKMEHIDPVFARDAEFIANHTSRCVKFALPSPFLVATRYWHEDYSGGAYPTREHFQAALSEILRAEAIALQKAGVDIIQLDDPALTYFCDARVMQGDSHDERLRQNWDIDSQFPKAVEAINQIVSGLEAEVHLHCCHSVYKRQSDVEGSYEPILPRLQNAKIDRINLEFAYTGTGDVTDLKYIPDSIGVGMGVVDVRTESPQSIEDIEAIGASGAKYLSPKKIAINPDCGFAPDAGEPPSIDEAFIKLKRMCAAAVRLREKISSS